MSNNTRVFNATRRSFLSYKQAVKAVENCACAWVDRGETMLRDLTLQEAIVARNQQARMREPLPFAELPGLIYEPACGRESSAQVERTLASEANHFAEAC